MKKYITLLLFSLFQIVFSLYASAQCNTLAYISNIGSSSVSVINVSTNAVTATVTVGNQPIGISVSPDASKVYVANAGSNTVSIINTSTNTVTATIPVGQIPEGISVSPDGSKVYVVNRTDNTVSVINALTNTVTATIGVGNTPNGVSVSPDGSEVYITNSNSNTVSVINALTNTVTATITVGNYPYGVTVSPDGSKVYVTNESDNTVSVINTATNTVTATIGVGGTPQGITVSPDGSKVYVINDFDNTVSVINTATNTVTATIGVGNSPVGISVSSDGSTVYAANEVDNTVSVINTSTNTVTATISVGNNPYAFGNFITPTCVIVLPLSFLSFTASLQTNNTALLNWQTTDEVNTDHFEIERSIDGKNYIAIGEIASAKTTSTANNNYSYTDNTLPVIIDSSTKTYYRLQEVDKDGSSKYSSIAFVGISNNTSKSFTINMYPNPAKNNVWITGSNIKTIRIVDNTGREYITQQASGNSSTEINIGALSDGIYFVSVTDIEGNQSVQKLIVQ